MAEKVLSRIDWLLVFFILPVVAGGLVTMKSFALAESGGDFFSRQIIWVAVAFAVFFAFAFVDFRFLKQTNILVFLFLFLSGILLLLIVLDNIGPGPKSWFNFGLFYFQPVDLMKLVLVLVLAKYFSRRHVEIRDVKHIFISGFYVFVPLMLVLLQPDFGSAMIILFIWLGMVLVSGISKKHLLLVFCAGAAVFALLWVGVFEPYQKARIYTFLNPMSDVHGSGYNVLQSTIAVGSGQFMGKGLGFGTQSRLKFLPVPQSDFVFASYAEEWGFVGSVLILILYCLIIWRILYSASLGASNFEILYGLGIAIFFMGHIIVNVGMNLGLLPVTGIPLPFMSYGGSHLLAEFMSLGILMSMRRYSRIAHRDDITHEFVGA